MERQKPHSLGGHAASVRLALSLLWR
jgi:hypothetical protein